MIPAINDDRNRGLNTARKRKVVETTSSCKRHVVLQSSKAWLLKTTTYRTQYLYLSYHCMHLALDEETHYTVRADGKVGKEADGTHMLPS